VPSELIYLTKRPRYLEGHDGFTSCGAAMQSASKLTLVIIYIVVTNIIRTINRIRSPRLAASSYVEQCE
jgi:hypothetical protein